LKKFNVLIRIKTYNLSACSIAPQPSTLAIVAVTLTNTSTLDCVRHVRGKYKNSRRASVKCCRPNHLQNFILWFPYTVHFLFEMLAIKLFCLVSMCIVLLYRDFSIFLPGIIQSPSELGQTNFFCIITMSRWWGDVWHQWQSGEKQYFRIWAAETLCVSMEHKHDITIPLT
jgi:hypothetical protein